MKLKIISILLVLFVVTISGGCSKDNQTAEKKLIVAATAVPHAEILEQVKPILKDEGIELDIQIFDDYIMPNKALAEKSVDANYFQTIPFLEQQNKDMGTDFVVAGKIHIEPIGVYSAKYASLDKLPDGAKILMSDSISDHGRILTLFVKNDLIKLRDGVEMTEAKLEDIVENKKNFVFDANYAPQLLAQIYTQGEGDAVVINSNFALAAGLNPKQDAIALEGGSSPYVNVVAVRAEDEKRTEIKKLVEVLTTTEIQAWILEKYGGSVVPVVTQ